MEAAWPRASFLVVISMPFSLQAVAAQHPSRCCGFAVTPACLLCQWRSPCIRPFSSLSEKACKARTASGHRTRSAQGPVAQVGCTQRVWSYHERHQSTALKWYCCKQGTALQSPNVLSELDKILVSAHVHAGSKTRHQAYKCVCHGLKYCIENSAALIQMLNPQHWNS